MVLPSYEKAMATAASVAGTTMLVRSLANDLLPYEARAVLSEAVGGLLSRVSRGRRRHTIVIDQLVDGSWYLTSSLYTAVQDYLAARIDKDASALERMQVSSMDDDDDGAPAKMVVGMDPGEDMADTFDGVEFRWCLVRREAKSDPSSRSLGQSETRFYELTFDKKHKNKALKEYLPFIVATAKADQERPIRIYMNEDREWSSVELKHPSTFDTLAMDPKQKQSIIDDLNRFIERKGYYRRIGKAWKRGYLLYGPPGTGKSSMIAAIANHLRFNIYDLELTGVICNLDLRKLLINMTNRSILVVEDIDCTIDCITIREETVQEEEEGFSVPQKKEEGFRPHDKVTLCGLLNLVDGLWSTSGEERIIIFTTNYKERLDPALLRPGRMDMHIHMGYCTQEAFRILASNYHSIDYHATYPEIEELIKEVQVTPAEVAEVLMRSDDTDAALHDLVELLKSKIEVVNEINTGNKHVEEEKDDREMAAKNDFAKDE